MPESFDHDATPSAVPDVATLPLIAEALAGSKVLLTGVTGFVGEALLHRLLTQVPDVRVSLLVRRRGSAPASDRIDALLKKPIFAEVVEAAGGREALVAERIEVVEGDLADVPPLPSDLDAVVHCAGDVSFDPAVDDAFITNVIGTRGLLARVAEAGDGIHYVHVSTAYVAGRRRGRIAERPVEHDVDIEAELAWALAQRDRVEHASRSAGQLAAFRTAAERDHGRAGLLTAATDTERRRREWVKEEMVRTGAERARSLGWTDCYTFTKALGERVVETWSREQSAPVTILRPSIIESALQTPHPGWIEGFKMAEPLILAFGRGELLEFPASPDGTVDIVPVDHVVAATVAVLATPPPATEPRYFHVSSGGRNPCTFGTLYDVVRDYFERHPFETGSRGAARLPEWRFPGAAAVERLLLAGERAHKVADYVIQRVPRGDATRGLARRLDEQQQKLESLRRYIDLYREYAKAELAYDDTQTMALFRSLHPDDQRDFAFDTSVIDWAHYLGEVHCPSVTAPVRRLDEIRRRRKGSGIPQVRKIATDGEPDPSVAAVFDMDGTLLSSNVVEAYLWMRLAELDRLGRLAEVGRMVGRLPSLIAAERAERSAFLRGVYRDYEGATLSVLDEIADEQLTSHVLSRLSSAALRRIRAHKAAGHQTVLITGAVRPLTRPLEPLFDHIEAVDLATDAQGVCTGHLESSPLVGESRAAWLRHWASTNGIDLKRSFAYADSHSDLPMLAAVGNPVVVQPDITLLRHAKRSHWPVVDWSSTESSSRSLAPRELLS